MKRIVVFSTSDIQTLERNCTSPELDEGYSLKSTGELERAIDLGFTVYVISTRHKLSETDKWWFDKANFVYLATSAMDSLCANSPALIAPWLKFFQELGIPLPPKARPEDDTEWLQDQLEGPLPQLYGFNSWLEARDYLRHGAFELKSGNIIIAGTDFRRFYP